MRILLLLAVLILPLQARAADPVLRDTLPNGMRVVIVTDRLAPVVSVNLNYLVGSNDSPPGFPGTAHALEHMMFRGARGLDRDQLSELAAQLGGAYNANTAETLTQYTWTAPARDLGLVLKIEALRMRGLTLAEADWTQERGAIEQEVSRDLSSPYYNFNAAAQAILFAGTPYEHDALGTRPSFDATDSVLLRAFYDRWYHPNNAVLVIAGDVDPPAALETVRRAFADLPAHPIPDHAPIPATAVAPQTIALETNLPVGLVALAVRMPGLRAPDFAAADILGDILGGQRGPLYALVPAGRALQSSFSFDAKADVGVGVALAAFPSGDDPQPLLDDLRRVLATLAAEGPPPALVDAARRQELAQLAFENDSIAGLARLWSRAVAVARMDSPADLARAYAAVTTEDVARLARQLLDPKLTVTAILTPRAAGQPPSGPGFGAPETFAAPPPDHPVVLPDWAIAALVEPRRPDPVELPTVSILPNGLRLIVKPEHVSPTVSVYGLVRENADMQEPQGKEGVSTLTSRLFDEGSTTRGRLAMRAAMDDLSATYSAGFGFSLKVLAPRFEDGMRLLAEAELHPALPEASFAIARAQQARSLAGALRTPAYRAGRALEEGLLPPGDPALRQATPASITALTPADVRAYYDAAFRPDLATIVVVGDITPEAARRVVEDSFGAWTAPGTPPRVDPPPLGPNPPGTAAIPDPSTLQDSVTLAATLTIPVDSPDRYPLLLGGTILGSGFSSRLYQDLRVRTGYVYSVGNRFDWTRTRARQTVSFGADTANVAAATALVRRDIATMQTTLVSDAELDRAKAQVLRQLPMQRASIGAIAAFYLRLVELDLPLDTARRLPDAYAAITAEQVRAAFARWLRPDDLIQVVRTPQG